MGTTQAAPVRTGPPGPLLQAMWALPAANSPTRSMTTAATKMPMTQPRTVRNLVHSACSTRPKPPAARRRGAPGRGGGGHRAVSGAGWAR